MKTKKPTIRSKSQCGSHSRSKGQRGERAAIDWLQPICDQVLDTLCATHGLHHNVTAPLLQRNTIQSDRGGFDVVGLPWLALEVKNYETDAPAQIEGWWKQAYGQAGPDQVPVLLYKRNHRPFRARMPGGWGRDFCWVSGPVDIDADQFEEWFRKKLRAELENKIAQNH